MTSIILAAGESKRMGENKLLLPFKGKTIIENTLLPFLSLSDRIIVVTGYEREKIEQTLGKYNVEFVYNKDYQEGQRSSSNKGLEVVENDDFIVTLGDLPLLKIDDILPLIKNLESITRPIYNNIPGHPVVFKKEHLKPLLFFKGSINEYVKQNNTKYIPSSISTIFDVDDKEKYKKLLENY